MNILYLSHLSGHYSSGPTYSVPSQIKAQAEFDDVYWFNAVRTKIEKWRVFGYYHDLNDIEEESVRALPAPFNKPDLIVVELFYNMFKSPLIRELINSDIPYIIIPRCELTEKAQRKKSYKKIIANMLICRKFAQKALAIEYLTEQEYKDSGDKWNRQHLIIPNAIAKPSATKSNYSSNAIKAVFIGRIEPYQKGLDLIIDAITILKETLMDAVCSFAIYGADKEDKLSELKKKVNERGLEDIVSFHDGVFGEDKEKVLLESDLFFLTSRFEGHPMALLEALSYGLPCIATTGSNMRDDVESFDAGWTADNTVESIKSAILRMLEDRGQIADKGKNAIRLAEKYYWPEIAKKSHDLYFELLNGDGGNV